MLDWPSVVIGSAATVFLLCLTAFLLYHFWPMDAGRNPRVRAERALQAKAASKAKYERSRWRNWVAW